MPSSNLWLAPRVVAMAAEVKPKRVLDVGPGFGKYGVLMREYVGPKLLECIEAEARYLERFAWLSAIYDGTQLGDVTDRGGTFFDRYDLVLMIDVLEHVDKVAGGELLARIPGRIIVCTPRDFFQNPEHREYPSEEHRSVWTALEIESAAGRPLEVNDADAWNMGGVLVRVGPR